MTFSLYKTFTDRLGASHKKTSGQLSLSTVTAMNKMNFAKMEGPTMFSYIKTQFLDVKQEDQLNEMKSHDTSDENLMYNCNIKVEDPLSLPISAIKQEEQEISYDMFMKEEVEVEEFSENVKSQDDFYVHYDKKSHLERLIEDHLEDVTVKNTSKLRKCSICCKIYTENKHESIHKEIISDICDKCHFVNENNINLIEHIPEDARQKIYKCYICYKRFPQRQNLLKHRLIHTGEKNHKCDVCGSVFSCRRTLKRHLLVHSGEKQYKCDTCNKYFLDKQYLYRHVLLHIGERPFKCEICFKTFSQKRYLTIHQLVHSGKKVHKCNICNKTFLRKQGLSNHLRLHGDKLYECDMCKHRFSQKQNLANHILKHSGMKREKPYKCDIYECHGEFSRKKYLIKHKLHHVKHKLRHKDDSYYVLNVPFSKQELAQT